MITEPYSNPKSLTSSLLINRFNSSSKLLSSMISSTEYPVMATYTFKTFLNSIHYFWGFFTQHTYCDRYCICHLYFPFYVLVWPVMGQDWFLFSKTF